MSKRQKLNATSSSSEVDFVRWCEDIVQRIQAVLKRPLVLYPRRCSSFESKLSNIIVYIRELVEGCARYKAAFVPLLEALHRYYEKAEVLVKQCAQEDLCAAAVFLYRNIRSFSIIVNDVGMKILELAKKYSALRSTIRNPFALDSREFYFLGRHEDSKELQTRLEVLAWFGSKSRSKILELILAQQPDLRQQHLAQYLLSKQKLLPYQLSKPEPFEIIMWEKEKEPAGTWGDSKFRGEGSGANGVWKTSWLGVPCVKKEFHGEASETIFLKEALIMARMKTHPCIVDFHMLWQCGGKRGMVCCHRAHGEEFV